MTEPILHPPGWGRPLSAQKWHFYEESKHISMCGKWLGRGPDSVENSNHDSHQNCTQCKKLRGAKEKK